MEPRNRPGVVSWHSALVLKADLFSTVERGRFSGPHGEVDAVRRRIDDVPWWTRPIARHLLARERRALMIAGSAGIAPPLLHAGPGFLIRGFLDGVALKIAKPRGDLAYFRSARSALRALHRAGVCHNDLAKEQNWLKGQDGRAYLLDFQLAATFSRRTKVFRIAAYEDLRHLLKHKRKYAPDALTARERQILAHKSLATRIWMATGKRLYRLVSRKIFGFVDAEGSGRRSIENAALIAALLRAQPNVREAAIVPFPNRRGGTGLYAFVEASPPIEQTSFEHLFANHPGPEFLQVVDALPRDQQGLVRSEILQLIATNQTDLITPLITSAAEQRVVEGIVLRRRNFYDAPATEVALSSHPQVRDAAVISFPDRLAGTGLYAFVEADPSLAEATLKQFMIERFGKFNAPRFIQRADQLPRDSSGNVRKDILQLIASNQIELITPLIRSATEQQLVDQLLAGRRNLHDRFVL